MHSLHSLLNKVCSCTKFLNTAFLNGQFEEEVYMKQPDGFVAPGNEHHVCRLPPCWNFVLDSHLKEMGSMFILGCLRRASLPWCVCQWHHNCCTLKQWEVGRSVKNRLAKCFGIKDMGKLHHFLGMKVKQDESWSTGWIGQPGYIEKLLKRFGIKLSPSPLQWTQAANSWKLYGRGWTFWSAAVSVCSWEFIITSLHVATRSDITFAVSNVAKIFR